jgi:hypothetical protein
VLLVGLVPGAAVLLVACLYLQAWVLQGLSPPGDEHATSWQLQDRSRASSLHCRQWTYTAHTHNLWFSTARHAAQKHIMLHAGPAAQHSSLAPLTG